MIEGDVLARKPGHEDGPLLNEDLACVVEDRDWLRRVPTNPADGAGLRVDEATIDFDDLQEHS